MTTVESKGRIPDISGYLEILTRHIFSPKNWNRQILLLYGWTSHSFGFHLENLLSEGCSHFRMARNLAESVKVEKFGFQLKGVCEITNRRHINIKNWEESENIL